MSCSGALTCLTQVAQLSEAEVEAWQSERAGEIDALVTDLKTAKDDRLQPRWAVTFLATASRAGARGGSFTGGGPRARVNPIWTRPGRPEGVIIAPVVVPAGAFLLVDGGTSRRGTVRARVLAAIEVGSCCASDGRESDTVARSCRRGPGAIAPAASAG